jgi:hypothetical protein
MTGDAGLPISSNSKKSILDALLRIEGEYDKPPEGPDGVALPIARACLAARAANYITYEERGSKLKKTSA